MPSTSKATTSRPRSRSRSRPALEMFPPIPAAQFAGAQSGEHCSLPQKVKRLKTRKERNHNRGLSISSFFHRKRESRYAKGCACQDCHSSHPSHNHSRKDKPVAKPFPPQRPSIITERRLTAIRGLFSHEVRSVDIERLVTNHRSPNSGENQQRQSAASNSPSVLSPLLFSPRPESGEADVSKCVQGGRKSSKKSKRSNSELNAKHDNAEERSSMKACHGGLEKVLGSGRICDQTGAEPAALSSKERDFFQSFSTPDKANKSEPPVPSREPEEQDGKKTAAMDEQHASHSALAKSSDLAACSGSPPALADNGQQKEPEALTTSEAVSRLAVRLCKTLPPLLRRHCPLLTECREVLLQTLQERSAQDGLHLQSPAELGDVTRVTEQASSSSEQRYEERTPMHFSFARAYEGAGQQSVGAEISADKSSQRLFVGGDVGKDTERGAANVKWKPHSWMSYSPQDVLTNLQSPCEDALDHWSLRIPHSEQTPNRADHHHNSLQGVFLHKAFSGPEILTPYSNNCETGPFDSCFPKPQMQAKLTVNENIAREINELLDQWSTDPDLSFLFHENVRRRHTSADLLTELRALSPSWQMENARERTSLGASSTSSAFFNPEGFSYEPYYRFPHPFINRSERSERFDGTLSPSLLLKTPYFRYSP